MIFRIDSITQQIPYRAVMCGRPIHGEYPLKQSLALCTFLSSLLFLILIFLAKKQAFFQVTGNLLHVLQLSSDFFLWKQGRDGTESCNLTQLNLLFQKMNSLHRIKSFAKPGYSIFFRKVHLQIPVCCFVLELFEAFNGPSSICFTFRQYQKKNKKGSPFLDVINVSQPETTKKKKTPTA